MVDETERLAEWIVNLKYNDIPKSVIEMAKMLILDDIGCQFGGSIQESNKALLRYARTMGGNPEATIVNYGDKTNVYNAAFVNASFGHGWDFDEMVIPGAAHQASATTAATMAMAEREVSDGRELLTAWIAGYETVHRIGHAATPGYIDRGFHEVGICGPFAGVGAAGKLLGLDAWEMENALSIAVSQGAGTYQHSVATGGAIKRCHAGFGSSSGVRSVLLAKEGITGAREALEGRKGFLVTHAAPDHDASRITDGLGKVWYTTTAQIKNYSCCAATFCLLDVIYELMEKHKFEADDVKEIVFKCGEKSWPMILNSTIRVPADNDIFGAQFSARWGVAMALLVGDNRIRGYQRNVPPHGKSGELAEFVKKIDMVEDKEMTRLMNEDKNFWNTKAIVTLRDGRVLEEIAGWAKGTVQNPMNLEERLDKFRGQAAIVISKAKQEKIIEIVSRLEDHDDILGLIPNLVR